MKCYCLIDLNLVSYNESYTYYECHNKKCQYHKNWFILIRDSLIFIKMGRVIQYPFGIFCTNDSDIHYSTNDILVDFKTMEKILSLHSMNEVKEYYNNYILFV